MDLTGDAGAKLSAALAALPAELQPVLQAAFDRLDALEARLVAAETSLESKAAADIAALEAPILKRLDDALAVGATLTGLAQQIVDRGLLISLGPKT